MQVHAVYDSPIAAGVTFNRNMYETILRELLVERAEHTVELYEGSGAAWRKVRCAKTVQLPQVLHTCPVVRTLLVSMCQSTQHMYQVATCLNRLVLVCSHPYHGVE